MVDIHFHPVSKSRSLHHRHHHHHGHHHGHRHRTHTVIECGDSKLCNGFFIFIFLAMIIGFIVAAVKGYSSENKNKKIEHYSNCNNKSQNKK